MGAESRAGSTAVESERAAYEEGAVLERSDAWVQRVHHVLETPNTLRGERLFARLIAESVQNGGRVLDAGCATGQTARQAVELGAGEAIQFDALLEHRYKALEDTRLLIAHIQKGKRF